MCAPFSASSAGHSRLGPHMTLVPDSWPSWGVGLQRPAAGARYDPPPDARKDSEARLSPGWMRQHSLKKRGEQLTRCSNLDHLERDAPCTWFVATLISLLPPLHAGRTPSTVFVLSGPRRDLRCSTRISRNARPQPSFAVASSRPSWRSGLRWGRGVGRGG